MKRLFTVVLVIALVLAVTGCAQKQTFINIASGGTGGTYYPLAGAMANIWQENIKGINASAQSTGASVANVNLLKEGNADIIFVQNDIAYYAATGTEMFKDKQYADLKGLCCLYPEPCQLITLASTGIKTVADLRGKKVSVGAAGSGVEVNARQIMESAGITYADINVQYLSFNESASNLKDGNIDAAFLTAGYPAAAVQDLAASKDIFVVPVTADLAAKLNAKYPFYTPTTIPAGTYKGQTAATPTVTVQSMLAVSSKLDSAVVEAMLKSMYENGSKLSAAHKAGSMIKKETGTEGMSLELHAGAKKYFGK